ncbi:MAG: T9SS type A sorting domain-containing protein, partial [Chitinophagaceae bacterium]
GPGTGIVGESIQFHGASDIYTLNGATSLATLFMDANTAMPYPAITSKTVGSNGGKAIAFTYDLNRSIVYTRQGNPAWAGQKRDGTTGPIRSDDMYFGAGGPDYVDFNKIAIPQADEQQRLLTNIILQSNLHRKPLPRFWFLPSDHKAVVVMTGDDHSFNGTTGQWNYFKTQGPNTPEDVANWKAIRGTSYIYNGTLSNQAAAAFDAEGFEVALHVNTNCSDVTAQQFQDDITSQMALFKAVLPNVSACVTNRNHCVTWSDWASVAKVQAQNGIRLDVNYYYWPSSFVQNRPGLFTGSGMPMRFADVDGTIIDCYQVTTQMSDEAAINYSLFANALLDKAQGPEGYYGVFCANMHTDSAVHSGANAIIASAIAHNVPVIAARQMLTWLDGRNGSSFGDMVWSNGQLSFTITALEAARNLKAMVPVQSESGLLTSITKDGAGVSYTVETIKGMQYAFFSVSNGTSQYVANYNASPVIITHPLSGTVCEGEQAGFKSLASGSPTPTVQWQSSTDGSNWTNISGATNGFMSVTATVADNNKQYRAVWTNSQGTTISNVAVLTVNPKPLLSSNLTAAAVSDQPFNYTPTSATAGTTFSWSRAAVAGIDNDAAIGEGAISETLVNTGNSSVNVIYVYTLMANGCTKTQNVVVAVGPKQGCAVTSSVVANFNNSSIAARRYIWFNSILDPAIPANSGTVNFYVTNSKITYTVNNQLVTLNVPDAHIVFASSVTPATAFINGVWETQVPSSYSGNVFMTGLSYQVPANLPGNISNVKWTATVGSDKAGVSASWKWAAAVYTNFTSNAGLNIKTTDGPIQILGVNITDKAATPLNYKLNVISGGTGGGVLSLGLISIGLLNYTGNYSSAATVSCDGRTQQSTARGSNMVEEEVVTPKDMAFDAKAMPNPSTNYFDILINGKQENNIVVRISDISGRITEQYQKVSAGTILRVGEKWKGGTYIVEIIQGDQRKILKLIKLN